LGINIDKIMDQVNKLMDSKFNKILDKITSLNKLSNKIPINEPKILKKSDEIIKKSEVKTTNKVFKYQFKT